MSKLTRPRFSTMVKTLQATLIDEKDCLYFVHTPQGAIEVDKWNYSLPGFVAISGADENGKYRFLVFSEETACSFPLEVKRNKEKNSKKTLGFKVDQKA